MTVYLRPIPRLGLPRPAEAHPLAGSDTAWFTEVECLSRDAAPQIVPAHEVDPTDLRRLSAARAPVAGLTLNVPRLMGIVNVTPDSFSDGGDFARHETAIAHGERLAADGADILDIGGESTRPGSDAVPEDEELRRTAPVISALRERLPTPISIDTRKAAVGRAALDAGADMLNDVAAFTYDPAMAELADERMAPVCLMHAQGDPKTMQQAPSYDDVLLDVYDFLAERVAVAETAGIPRERVVVDPGIGFGKTVEHNLALLARLSLFHGLGCALLLGASRKRFIGTIGGGDAAKQRVPGSLAVALAGAMHGAHIIRVHDVAETRQALALWTATTTGRFA
ncbi:dihydropteroate synthase [Tranquillimonas alkanivorans]|uniref:Dihydropteroate synthase n=1 Tax=Tranquillimonas alkanivorans TaxID=441119 RepID=A0A1I5KJH5_9RHOB|nr:dihydropteroate synthase [Tranquillimonas alkanivorans]SFO85234.1 Dihydropteroate synthase [Tranquillimonas alkanivorans]